MTEDVINPSSKRAPSASPRQRRDPEQIPQKDLGQEPGRQRPAVLTSSESASTLSKSQSSIERLKMPSKAMQQSPSIMPGSFSASPKPPVQRTLVGTGQAVTGAKKPQNIAIPSVSSDEDIAESFNEGHFDHEKESVPVEMLEDVQPPDAYGEDFEDYDEDFDDFEQEEVVSDDDEVPDLTPPKDILDVQRAVAMENERASSRQSQRLKESDSDSSKRERVGSDLPKRQMIDLHAAHKEAQKAKALSKAEQIMNKRAKDLSNLIELDIAMFDIMDLAPLNEYELYIRNFGSSNTAQESTQTNEDLVDHDTQTDDWEVEDKWSQAPSDFAADVGSGKPDLPWLRLRDEKEGRKERKSKMALAAVDSIRLVEFLRKASQVMDVLLDENMGDRTGASGALQIVGSTNVSQGYTTVNRPPFLIGRFVQEVCYASTDHRLVLTAMSPSLSNSSPTNPLRERGLLCLWRLQDLSTPHRVLICDGTPMSICFAPNKPTLICAGSEDGSIYAWDLQDPVSQYPTVRIEGVDWNVRWPSYSTDGLYATKRAHESSIRKIWGLQKGAREGSEGDGGGPVQIASVDSTGGVQIWTVIEGTPDSMVDDIDLGMRIGCKLQLVRSSSFQVQNSSRTALTPLIDVTAALPLTSSSSAFLLGTSTRSIQHESRFRDRLHPSSFHPVSPTMTPTCDGVTSLAQCPHDHRIFIAGFELGTVSLFDNVTSKAVRSWDIQIGIKQVHWSPHRPGVFYVLDEGGMVHVWDLIEKEAEPVYLERFGHSRQGRVVAIALSSVYQYGTNAATNGNQMSLAASASRNGTIFVSFEHGEMEVHLLARELVEVGIDEETVIDNLLGYKSEKFDSQHD